MMDHKTLHNLIPARVLLYLSKALQYDGNVVVIQMKVFQELRNSTNNFK